MCLREVALGGSLVVAAAESRRGRRLDLEKVFGEVEEFSVTHLAVAPPVVKKYELSSLEVVMSGGAPVASTVIERIKAKFSNISLIQGYGLTKISAAVTRPLGGFESDVKGSNGRLVSNCQARIVDPLTGDSLPPLRPGELWIRGPTVMKDTFHLWYVDDKEATAAMVDSVGWLRTGDICFFDENGLLFYVERLKDLIKYNGYQVAPAELEDLLLSHPAIVEAADAGQIPAAFVVKEPGSTINESLIMDFVAQKVAPYKKIRRIFFTDTIPKNAPGKVLRKELVKLATRVASKL
ncbi:hypothetical protein SASPL_115917 [Salvia splendens]|uniref:4-coumarate--CoA ligase n=1 Tax=Salvia splendens TaxID=180675 RepID=A0A8X8Y5X9_SALSN|nr:hypothetical protein SASPL_115917 [Salvia splendens]